jgi:hypothetical protein
MLVLAALVPLLLLELVVPQSSATVPPGCDFSKSPLAPVSHLCKTSLANLHLTCFSVTWRQAAQACAQFGLRLAPLTDANILYGQELLRSCLYSDEAWIGAFGGLNAEVAMAVGRERVRVRADQSGLGGELLQVMCEDVPVDTITTSLSTTTTISNGTITSTTTTTTTTARRHRHHHDGELKSNQNNCVPCQQQQQNPPSSACHCCSAACPASHDGLHIVTGDLMTADDARAACHRYGWHLADYFSGMTSVVKEHLVRQCGLGAEWQLWVRSFEGVSPADCVKLEVGDGRLDVVFGLTDNFCNGVVRVGVAALCQEQPPFVTGIGPYEGRHNTTTLSLISTLAVRVPVTTTTVTKTVTCHRH